MAQNQSIAAVRSRIPSPAIVAQEAVRRLPRWPLLLLCTVYVLAGFVGREPWKSADIAGFGVLFDVIGTSDAAWLVTRLTAALMLSLTLVTTWYSMYYLAKRDSAQPVPFAFGGEAKSTDYARALADGALLALIACLGMAQLSHETTPALVQLAITSLAFFGIACYRYHRLESIAALALAVLGLGLLWRGGFIGPAQWDVTKYLSASSYQKSAHLLVWFAWPAWALALLALVKWRRHWLCSRPASHIVIPFGFVAVHLALLPASVAPDRWFLSALPALACLAAFALPTLRRNLKALVDWFTLLFFSGCALVIWVVWLAMTTGIPPQPAANVARLAPLFTPSYSLGVVVLALAATVGWGWLVVWRAGRHRPALWMSMVLPAGGAVLCWTLLMGLWLPLLDHARSYKPLMLRIQSVIQSTELHSSALPPTVTPCLQVQGLGAAQQAALRYYLDRPLVAANRDRTCEWLIVDIHAQPSLSEYTSPQEWQLIQTLRRPTDDNEDWLIFKRITQPNSDAKN
jgi:hypothetical protein